MEVIPIGCAEVARHRGDQGRVLKTGGRERRGQHDRAEEEGHMVIGPGAAKRESKASYRRRARLHISFFRKLRRLAHRLQHQGDRPRNSLRVVSATTTTESEPTVVHVGPSEPRGRTLTQITGTETLYVSVRFVGP